MNKPVALVAAAFAAMLAIPAPAADARVGLGRQPAGLCRLRRESGCAEAGSDGLRTHTAATSSLTTGAGPQSDLERRRPVARRTVRSMRASALSMAPFSDW